MKWNFHLMQLNQLLSGARFLLGTILAFLLLLAIAGCSDNASREDTERLIAARAPDFMGPADHYLVETHGISTRQVDLIRITGVGVMPDPNLKIDPLVLTLSHVRYQRHPFRVLQVGDAVFEGRISESAINQYLLHQHRAESGSVKNLRLTIERGLLRVDASASVSHLDIPVKTSGFVRIEDGLRFRYTAESLRILGVGVPAGIQQLLTDMVNPVADISGLRFAPHVTRVLLEPGAITFSGSAKLRIL